MKTKTNATWKYVTLTAIAFLMLAIIAVFYSSTISNAPHTFNENPICYHSEGLNIR